MTITTKKIRLIFDEVSVTVTKTWREDGKKRQRTKKFWQTMNPFNRNEDGSIKTREQIVDEVYAEAVAWKPWEDQ